MKILRALICQYGARIQLSTGKTWQHRIAQLMIRLNDPGDRGSPQYTLLPSRILAISNQQE